MSFKDRIAIDSRIMHGKPVIKGTRIPVYIVLNLMANGLDSDQVVDEYPDLNREDVLACLEYASKLTEEEVGVVEADEVV